MSNTYEVDGVTVTTIGGGYYDLTHPSLTDPERVQGKEKAEMRAREIAKAAEKPEGQMEPQGELDAPIEIASPVADPDDIVALKAKLAAAEARAEELEKAASPIVTTVTAAEPSQPAIPATLPREYTGQMDPKAKAALKKMGIGISTIVLEENDSIPPTGLFISHNGRPYQIKPGEEVDVPDFLISVLDDAVMSAPMVDSTTQKILGYRNRSKYPYRRVETKG